MSDRPRPANRAPRTRDATSTARDDDDDDDDDDDIGRGEGRKKLDEKGFIHSFSHSIERSNARARERARPQRECARRSRDRDRAMDSVLEYVSSMNRPLNATNVGDALGSKGIKKGLAQKYLDALCDRGALCGKDNAGKGKVYYPPQEACENDGDAIAEVHAKANAVQVEMREMNTEAEKLRATLRVMQSLQSVGEMTKEKKALDAENEALRARLAPLRDSEAQGDVITEAERVDVEDAFLKSMEVWLERRRKFNLIFESVLEGTGEPKKKLWDSAGFESESDVGIDYDKYRKLMDDVKKQRIIDARMKRMKTF